MPPSTHSRKLEEEIQALPECLAAYGALCAESEWSLLSSTIRVWRARSSADRRRASESGAGSLR